MDGLIEETLQEFFRQAAEGKVKVNDEIYNVAFNTKIVYPDGRVYQTNGNDSYPTLYINNYPLFKSKLADLLLLQNYRTNNYYRRLQDKMRFLIAYSFANATFDDFANPLSYLDRTMAFIKNTTLTETNEIVDLTDTPIEADEVLIQNQKQSIYMETPNKMTFTLHGFFNDEEYVYRLPEISYGICEENGEKVCYIYSSLNPEKLQYDNDEMGHIYKKLQRSFYKVNKTVSEEPDLLNLSPSSIISMSLFLGLLEKEGIRQFKVIDYLPVRYNSRDIIAQELKKFTEKLQERNDHIQTNATNKFTSIFVRMTSHLPNLTLKGELGDGIMRFQLDPSEGENDDLVNQLYNKGKNIKNQMLM